MIDYSIKELAEISGIKAHTIRIWEQRYNLLSPARTETNIRRYNDEDLKKLLNVSELVNHGKKISRIVSMTNAQRASEIDAIIKGADQTEPHFETIINQLIIAFSAFDEYHFETSFAEAINRWGMVSTYTHVIYPVLIKTGLMWSNSEILPAQEHFLSNLVRQKIFAGIDALPVAHEPAQTWVLFLNEEEEHEIGLLFANFILKQCGQRVIYLGSNVPYQNLSSVVNQCRPSHIYTFFVKKQPEEKRNELIDKMKANFKNVNICISGKEEFIGSKSTLKPITLIKDIETLKTIATTDASQS